MLLIYELYVSESASKYIRIYALTLKMIGLLYDCCQMERRNISTEKTKDILKYTKDPELRKLAENIVTTQSKGVEEMTALLKKF